LHFSLFTGLETHRSPSGSKRRKPIVSTMPGGSCRLLIFKGKTGAKGVFRRHELLLQPVSLV